MIDQYVLMREIFQPDFDNDPEKDPSSEKQNKRRGRKKNKNVTFMKVVARRLWMLL